MPAYLVAVSGKSSKKIRKVKLGENRQVTKPPISQEQLRISCCVTCVERWTELARLACYTAARSWQPRSAPFGRRKQDLSASKKKNQFVVGIEAPPPPPATTTTHPQCSTDSMRSRAPPRRPSSRARLAVPRRPRAWALALASPASRRRKRLRRRGCRPFRQLFAAAPPPPVSRRGSAAAAAHGLAALPKPLLPNPASRSMRPPLCLARAAAAGIGDGCGAAPAPGI
ncbi:hypothetical protein BDR26DRAFT_906520 [Obelidium mucronatum]|nr:hypothetical protein BDR26DRAFT_906520 [Obelidium mucronatum]